MVYNVCFLAKLKNLRQLDILGNRNVSLGALQVGAAAWIFTNIFFIISSILISYQLIVARLCLPSLWVGVRQEKYDLY